MNTTKYKLPSSVLLAVLFALITNLSYAQLRDNSLNNYSNVREVFYMDPLVFYSGKDSNAGRLDLYVEVPYERIQFKKNSSNKDFVASITYNIKVTDAANQTVINESYSDQLTVPVANAKTYKDDSKYYVQSFSIKPGNYNAEVIFKDNNAKSEITKDKKFKVGEISSTEVYTSNLMIVSNYEVEAGGKKKITPSVNNNLGVLKEFYVFYEVYNPDTAAVTVNYSYLLSDNKTNPVTLLTKLYTLNPGINKIIEKISTEKITIGDFSLALKDNGTGKIIEAKNISNRWTDIPVSIKDIDVAISQLQYIATSEEMDELRNAKTNADKEKKFIEFWKKKDPSPATPRNEMMIEYYNRIRIANEKFSHYNEGWRTDMGMVFIIYGNPSNIDRHPFENQTKPYEVWDYYDINRQFVFVDDTGFGDYRLITPIYDDFRMR